MNPFLRHLATALLEGTWREDALLARLRERLGGEPRWMERLVADLVGEFGADGPGSVRELVEAIVESYALIDAVRERPLARGYETRIPEMHESPWRVPALATSKELASWMGLEVPELVALADERGISRAAADERRRHYRYRWVAKRGGYRLLEAPKRRLRSVQRCVLDDILAHVPPHAAAHGFRPQHSISTFAAPHVGRAVVIRLDLQAFFTSVRRARVAAIFEAAGYPTPVAYTLAALCTHRTPPGVLMAAPRAESPSPTDSDASSQSASESFTAAPHFGDSLALARLRSPHLPQGAPTSGALANLAAFGLDVRISAFASSIGARYTRYADDLAISGDRDLVRAAPSIIARVGAIAIEEGFSLNFRKTRVMTSSGQQRITGLVVNDKLAVPRVDVDRLRAILHNCIRTGPDAQNREHHAEFRAHLLGRIAWVASIDGNKGARLRALFDRIAWPTTTAR